MTIHRITRARARRALHDACRGHLYDPNVTSIDVGFPRRAGQIERGKLAIRFHVAQKLYGVALETAALAGETEPLPAYVGEFETDVLEGRYRPRWWTVPGRWSPTVTNPRMRRQDPVRGGISVSRDGAYGSGTLGSVVTDRATGRPMILSNWHVFVADWATRPGVAVYQPGLTDGGTFQDMVGRYARDAMPVNLDAAVATVNGARGLSREQLGLGAVRGVAAAEPGMLVVKSGRTTGITQGEVTGVDGAAKLTYRGLDRVIRQVVTIDQVDGVGVVSDAGDSGSLWLDASTDACVALHFAGSNVPERALGMDIGRVLDALGVDLV